jgi:hypothetical protein
MQDLDGFGSASTGGGTECLRWRASERYRFKLGMAKGAFGAGAGLGTPQILKSRIFSFNLLQAQSYSISGLEL